MIARTSNPSAQRKINLPRAGRECATLNLVITGDRPPKNAPSSQVGWQSAASSLCKNTWHHCHAITVTSIIERERDANRCSHPGMPESLGRKDCAVFSTTASACSRSLRPFPIVSKMPRDQIHMRQSHLVRTLARPAQTSNSTVSYSRCYTSTWEFDVGFGMGWHGMVCGVAWHGMARHLDYPYYYHHQYYSY